MNKEQEQKIKEALANGFLNAFNINVIVEACKIHALRMSEEKFKEMSDEEKNDALNKLLEAQEKKTE